MKFVLFIVAVFALLWLLKRSFRGGPQPPRAPRADASAPQEMLTCAHCGVHMPRDEALPGRGGVFCDEKHRAAYEQAHPDA